MPASLHRAGSPLRSGECARPLNAIARSGSSCTANNLWSPGSCCLIHDRHYSRLETLLRGAQAEGRVLLGGEFDPERRRIAPSLIAVRDDHDPLMADELFGPLLPVLSIPNLDAAIAHIQKQDKPLALYLFGGDTNDQKQVLRQTSSGGVCFNDVVMQAVFLICRSEASAPAAWVPTMAKRDSAPFPMNALLRRPFWLDLLSVIPLTRSARHISSFAELSIRVMAGGTGIKPRHLMVRPATGDACAAPSSPS